MLPPTITALLQTLDDKAVKAQFFAYGTASALENIRRNDAHQAKDRGPIKRALEADCMLIHYFDRLKKSNEGETEMKTTEAEMAKPSYWQLIFLQSKVNGAGYSGEALPGRNWDWPKNTYLQRRLHQARYLRVSDASKLN